MSLHRAFRAHPACWTRRCALSLALLLAASAAGLAEQPASLVRVEEDWELVVLEPDVDSNAPQVTCAISPSGGIDSYYISLEINFRSLPSYSAGGLQYQMWNGETHLLTRSFPENKVMGTSGETVRWTQTMRISGGNVTYEVVDGTSTTWGNFGGQGYLRASVATDLDDLALYSPDVSVENSAVGYAANRVQKLELTRVRYYFSDSLVVEDNAPRVVYQHE